MKKLIDILYDHLINSREIPEDLLYEFSQNTIKIIQHHASAQIPPSFWNLQHYVEMFWRGRKYQKEKNTVFVYQMGQLLTCTNMIRDVVDADVKTMSISDYARRWDSKYPVYKGIHDKPGINHKKLAAVSENSISSLSQFISKTKWDGYIIYRSAGREKYYYLTENGEKLYKLLREKRQKACRFKKVRFRNLDTNNSGYYYDALNNKEKILIASISGNESKPRLTELTISNAMGNMDQEKNTGGYKELKKEALYAAERIRVAEY